MEEKEKDLRDYLEEEYKKEDSDMGMAFIKINEEMFVFRDPDNDVYWPWKNDKGRYIVRSKNERAWRRIYFKIKNKI